MTMEHIGDNIRKIRVFLGIKQSVMAQMLGLSVNSYGKIERNQVLVKPKRLQAIAAIFNVAPSYIVNINDIFDRIRQETDEV